MRGWRRGLVGIAGAAAILASFAVPVATQAATIPEPTACVEPAPDLPTISTFAFTPHAVNVTGTSQALTFTVHATDAGVDIAAVSVVVSPEAAGVLPRWTTRLKLVGGTVRSGTWTGVWSVPKGIRHGHWNVRFVQLDRLHLPPAFVGPADPGWSDSWPTRLWVQSATDSHAPVLVSAVSAPRGVDTSSSAKTVTLTVHATDDYSGLSSVSAYASGVTVGYRTTLSRLRRTSGSALDGVYTGGVTIPRFATAGVHVWSLVVALRDAAGNGHVFSVGTVRVRSTTDASKPVVTSLALSPPSVDARGADARVDVTLNVTDVGSGVGPLRYNYGAGAPELLLESPSGVFAPAQLERTAGTSLDGTWTGSVLIKKCSEPGPWHVGNLLVWDLAGRYTTLNGARLQGASLPGPLAVQAVDVAPPTARAPGTAPAGGPVLVTFSEPTLWQGNLKPVRVSDSYGASVPGTWTCTDDSSATVGCNADGADVAAASFMPTQPLTVGAKYRVTVSPRVFDLVGNGPMSYARDFTAT